MNRFPMLCAALFLTACATPAAPLTVTLPMTPPPMPSQDGPKDRPLPVGAVVPVPRDAGVIDAAALPWREGRAQVVVEWPGVHGLQLHLRAEGDWPADARVRVLDTDGEPLHIDHWSPARIALWSSATVDGCCMVVDIEGRPADGARLVIVEASSLRGAR